MLEFEIQKQHGADIRREVAAARRARRVERRAARRARRGTAGSEQGPGTGYVRAA